MQGASQSQAREVRGSDQARSITRNMVSVTVGRLVTAFLGLAVVMLFTRYLGPEAFGEYRTILAYVSFVSIVAHFGLYMITLREISRSPEDEGDILGAALLLRLLSTSAVLSIGAIGALALPYSEVVKRGILVGSLVYTAYQATELLMAPLQRHRRQGRGALAEVAGGALMLILVLVAMRIEAGVLAMVAALLAGSLLTLGLTWVFTWKIVPFRPHVDRRLWTMLLKAGLPLAASHVLFMAVLRGDTVLLSLMKPASEVGLYGVPTKLFEVVTNIPFLFAGLMTPLFARAARRDPELFESHVRNAVSVMTMFGVGTAASLVLFAKPAVILIGGAEYAPAAPALGLLGLAAAAVSVAMPLRFALVTLDAQKRVLLADSAGFVVAFAAYLVLIPRFSFVGAAAGTVAAEATILGVLAAGLAGEGHRLSAPRGLMRILIAAACMYALVVVLTRFGLHWIPVLVLGGIAYVGLLLFTKMIPMEYVRGLLARNSGEDGFGPS